MADTSLERPTLFKDHLRLVPEGGFSKEVLLYMYLSIFDMVCLPCILCVVSSQQVLIEVLVGFLVCCFAVSKVSGVFKNICASTDYSKRLVMEIIDS